MFLNILRQIDTKSIGTNKYNVYDSFVLVKGRKHYILTNLRKKDTQIGKNFGNIVAYPNNIFKSTKVIFHRYDVSYLAKKLLCKLLSNKFLALKSYLIQRSFPKKVYNFKAFLVFGRVRSKNYIYNKGKLVYALGKSFFLPQNSMSYISKKLPFKVFRLFVILKLLIRKMFFMLHSSNMLKNFFSLTFIKALRFRFLMISFVLPIFLRKIEKSIYVLSKAAFV